jgi:hypothetical protein
VPQQEHRVEPRRSADACGLDRARRSRQQVVRALALCEWHRAPGRLGSVHDSTLEAQRTELIGSILIRERSYHGVEIAVDDVLELVEGQIDAVIR